VINGNARNKNRVEENVPGENNKRFRSVSVPRETVEKLPVNSRCTSGKTSGFVPRETIDFSGIKGLSVPRETEYQEREKFHVKQ